MKERLAADNTAVGCGCWGELDGTVHVVIVNVIVEGEVGRLLLQWLCESRHGKNKNK